MTTAISIGPAFPMLEDVIYALPACRCILFTTGSPTLEQSYDVGFTANKAVTLDTNNQAEVAGGFIRCTSSGPQTIFLKKV